MRARRAALLLALLSASGCGPRRASDAGDAAGGKARIQLSASAVSGFSPLTIRLMGRLSGVAPDDANWADPAERWEERYGELESTSERQPGVGKVKVEAKPKLFYEKTITLVDPGSYRFQLRLTGADGEAIGSSWVTVRVILKE